MIYTDFESILLPEKWEANPDKSGYIKNILLEVMVIR